jgi:hypothetical protein
MKMPGKHRVSRQLQVPASLGNQVGPDMRSPRLGESGAVYFDLDKSRTPFGHPKTLRLSCSPLFFPVRKLQRKILMINASVLGAQVSISLNRSSIVWKSRKWWVSQYFNVMNLNVCF